MSCLQPCAGYISNCVLSPVVCLDKSWSVICPRGVSECACVNRSAVSWAVSSGHKQSHFSSRQRKAKLPGLTIKKLRSRLSNPDVSEMSRWGGSRFRGEGEEVGQRGDGPLLGELWQYLNTRFIICNRIVTGKYYENCYRKQTRQWTRGMVSISKRRKYCTPRSWLPACNLMYILIQHTFLKIKYNFHINET